MKTNILTLAITLTIGVILCGSLMVPVISDAQNNMSTETYTNIGNASAMLDLVDGEDTYTITYENSSYNLNGASIYSCAIYTDHGWMFIGSNSISAQYARGDVTTTAVTTISSVSDAQKIEITSDEIVVTDSSDNTYTTEIGWAYVTDSNGKWAVIQGDHVYTKELDSLRYIRTFGTYMAVMEGDSAVFQNQTFSDFLDATELPNGGYEVAMPLVISSEWTSQQVIAPVSFDVKVTTMYDGLFSAIIVIMIASLVVVAAGAIALRRD